MQKFRLLTARYDVAAGGFDTREIEELLDDPVVHIEKVDSHFFTVAGEMRCAVAVVYRVADAAALSQSKSVKSSSPPEIADADLPLYEALRQWRTLRAKRENTPAYVFFNNRQLATIARVRPKSVEELRRISGVGSTKCRKYGAEVVQIVRRHSNNGSPDAESDSS